MGEKELLEGYNEDTRFGISKTSELIKERRELHNKTFDFDKLLISVIGVIFGIPLFTPSTTDNISICASAMLIATLFFLVVIILLRLQKEKSRISKDHTNYNLWLFWNLQLITAHHQTSGAIKNHVNDIKAAKKEYIDAIYITRSGFDYSKTSFKEIKAGAEEGMKKALQDTVYSIGFEIIAILGIIIAIFMQIQK